MSQFATLVRWRNTAQNHPQDQVELKSALRGYADLPIATCSAPGAQMAWAPMSDEDERRVSAHLLIEPSAEVAVATDCRLDNDGELRRELGVVDSSHSEALLVLRAYRAWGDDFVRYLKGDFSGVVWDWGRRRLLGFRDAIGVRPLFYARLPDGIAAASDVGALVSLVSDRGAPDDVLVVEHLTWDYHSTDRTFWRNIRRLPGGHTIKADAERVTVDRYWHPPARAQSPPTAASIDEQFRELFFASVRRRLDGNGPILAHLSGGVDSSAIVCVADRILRGASVRAADLHVISARYQGLKCDEGEYIDAVTREIALPAESWDGRSDEFPDLTAPDISGPGLRSHRADGSRGEFAIARRLGARTILSGLGGDHLGAPFGVAEERARSHPARYVWETISRADLNQRQRLRRVRFLLRAMAPSPVRRFVAARRARGRSPDWLQPRWRRLAGDLSAAWSERSPERFDSAIQEARWRELTGARLGHSLDADYRCAAEQGVTMRYPFLDQELVTLVLSTPSTIWKTSEHHFRLHRAVLADLLPESVRCRTDKAAFSHIVAHRVRSAAELHRRIFFAKTWASERWVDQRRAQQLLDRALAGSLSDDDWPGWQAIRAIASLETWNRTVFGYHSAANGPGGRSD